jgi:hypothetical protein
MFSSVLVDWFPLAAEVDYSGERIIYEISPLGAAEYNDLGIVELEGKKVKLVTFKTKVVGFSDLEKIYCDPETLLPLRVERYVAFLFRKEYLVEEYNSKESSLVIKKYVGNKEVKEYHFKANDPIHNAILLPFSLRAAPTLGVGWSLESRFPDTFKISLVSLDEITVPAGKFKAYHFTSQPHKFEIWISQDADRIPIKIKGVGGYSYTLVMKKRIFNTK